MNGENISDTIKYGTNLLHNLLLIISCIPPSMRRHSDVSFRSHIVWCAADHTEVPSRRRSYYVNKTDLPSWQKDIYKMSERCLTKTSKTSCQDILLMSKRCLQRKSERHLRKTSWRDLGKIYCRCLTEDVLKMNYRWLIKRCLVNVL